MFTMHLAFIYFLQETDMQIPIKLAAFLALFAALAAPGRAQAPSGQPQDSFKIAVVVPFSGVYGILGQSIRRGIEVALEERGGRVLGSRWTSPGTTTTANPRSACRRPPRPSPAARR